MRWRPIAGVVLRQVYLMRSSPARMLPLFAWVLIDIVLWGFMARYLNRITAAGLDFIPLLLGAVLFWAFFTRVMQGVSMAFFEDVWSRNFINVFAAPISLAEYVAGLVLTSMATSAIGLTLALIMASAVFGFQLFGVGALLVPFALVLFLFGTALGIVACGLVLRFGPAAEWLIWPIPALLSPFAGVFYPLSTLPAGMRWFSRVLPPAYVFEDMRAVIAGQHVAWSSPLMAAGLACLHVALAAWLFTRAYRYAARHGLIARYSAEGVG